jgi:two-component system chemotaxis response regulator CheY
MAGQVRLSARLVNPAVAPEIHRQKTLASLGGGFRGGFRVDFCGPMAYNHKCRSNPLDVLRTGGPSKAKMESRPLDENTALAPEQSAPAPRKELVFLLVDDSQSMRKIIKRGLSKLGYVKTLEAYDGKDALRVMAENQVDFVICDWNMPRMKGIDLLRELRTREEYKSLPFLMVSAEAKTEDIFEAIQSGVTNYLPKPFSVEMLQRKIEAVLQITFSGTAG